MAARCYPKQPIARDVHEAALLRIREAYRRYDRVAVSFSGGKDSTVCLQLAIAVATELGRLPVEVFHWDEEAITPETVEYVDRVLVRPDVALRRLCLPIQHRNACSKKSPWWYPWAPEDRAKWCRPLPAGAITVDQAPGFVRRPAPEQNAWLYPPSSGRVAIIIGIRSSESLARYRAISTNKQGFEACFGLDDTGKWIHRCFPIYDWTSEDVWLAPHLFGWDHNGSYALMAAAGIPLNTQRVAPPYGEEPAQGLWMFKTCWPELWAKMCTRVPGAATAARYSRTELYGFGKIDEPPPGTTWAEFVEQSILRFNGEARAKCAHSLAEILALHRKTTSDPLPDTEDHPLSGLCWRRVAMIAIRGDLKGRRYRLQKTKRDVSQPEPGRY